MSKLFKGIRIEENFLKQLTEKYPGKNFTEIINELICTDLGLIKKEKKIITKQMDQIILNQEIILNILNSLSLKEFEEKIYFGDRYKNASDNLIQSVESEKEKRNSYFEKIREKKFE